MSDDRNVFAVWHGTTSQAAADRLERGTVFPGLFVTSAYQEAYDYTAADVLDPQDAGRVVALTVTADNPLVFYGSRPRDAEAHARSNGHDVVVVHYAADMTDPSSPMPERFWLIVLDPSKVSIGHHATETTAVVTVSIESRPAPEEAEVTDAWRAALGAEDAKAIEIDGPDEHASFRVSWRDARRLGAADAEHVRLRLEQHLQWPVLRVELAS